ncbi:MAG: DUF5606 domain-containing protein [Mucilaginibacter polytrichastri]|nr:DUF5606 domain-containing protein [Mucilaginibacter polytrichastri]
MDIKNIVAVQGKPGLWKALAQNKTGFILESLDEKKNKLVVNLSTSRLSALDEITIYTFAEEDLKLREVFSAMKASGNVPDVKADGDTLRKFFFDVAPDHDDERVYASDIKKIINWYNILEPMGLLEESAAAEEAPVAEAEVPEEVQEPAPKPKKKTAKKEG